MLCGGAADRVAILEGWGRLNISRDGRSSKPLSGLPSSNSPGRDGKRVERKGEINPPDQKMLPSFSAIKSDPPKSIS